MEYLHDEEFLELNELILHKYKNDFSISEFDMKTYQSFAKYYIQDSEIRPDIYTEAQELKMEYFKDIIPNGFAAELPLIDADFYHENMFKIVLGQVIFWGSKDVMINNEEVNHDFDFRKKLSEFFTSEGIRNNKLTNAFAIQYKQNGEWKEIKYPEGMKITRFFVSLFSNLQIKNRDNEKMIGKMRLDPNDYQDIYLSTYLPVFIRSGIIGSSCLSPDGSNSHGSFMNSGYPNLAVIHDAGFNNRAWLVLDKHNKKFSIAHCYPHENHYLQISARNYMTSKGYQEVNGSYFSFNEYIDLSPTKGLEIEHSTLLRENSDSDHDYGKSIFKTQNYTSYNCVCEYYSCDSCDRRSMDPSFIYANGCCYECYEEDENHTYCHACNEYIHTEDSIYDEETGESYCQYCYDDLIKKRDEEEKCELDEVEETLQMYAKTHLNLDLPDDINLESFVEKYKNYIIDLVKDNTITVKSNHTFNINKGIEYKIAMTYFEVLGYKWLSGHKPNEIKIDFYGRNAVDINVSENKMTYMTRKQRHNIQYQNFALYLNKLIIKFVEEKLTFM